jgi:NADH:ubiquinone oxidoreductase subunit 5 (subunit L)/multisubunit Na+/H+ antiporter MnhA subunit
MFMLLLTVFLPFIFGGISLILPKRTKELKSSLAIGVTLVGLVLSIFILRAGNIVYVKEWMPSLGINFSLRAYTFSAFILLFINLFGLLISMYSIKFMRGRERLSEYYGYLLFTIGASAGAVLANNLILFLVFWGIVLLTLYGLLSLGSYRVATKGLSIIGFSDFCLLLGILFLWGITRTFGMSEISKIPLTSGLAISAFLLMMIGAIAKAGAMPFHTWIPDAAEKAPVPVMALLPASLDKLLGIYLLTRICMDFFRLTPNSILSIVLMVIGSVTIVVAVLMALVQHNIIKLLSYHAVSQVGYMVLGIGTAIPIGIAGGIFHMLNHSIYKACLFLVGGSAKRAAGTPEIDRMGALSGILPVTFVTGLIAALSISGVPPFNGFFSKWMVYQGVIEAGTSGQGWISNLWIVWLSAAMFGSALTLASFMKFIHGTFLGQPRVPSAAAPRRKAENFSMATPMIILAGLCVAFGIFAYAIPLKLFIAPALGETLLFSGFWSPTLATILIIIGIVIGGIVYLVSRVRPVKGLVREDTSFIGGESVAAGELLPTDGGEPIAAMRVSGVEFYDTIREHEGLKGLYDRALRGVYDFYNWGIKFFKGVAYSVWTLGDRLSDRLWSVAYKFVLGASKSLKKTHTGILTTYILWMFIGITILLLILSH